MNICRYLLTIGPRKMAGSSSPVSMPIDIAFRPCRSAGMIFWSPASAGGWPVESPSIPGMLGPRTPASTSPMRPPSCCSANARFTLTVDFPTPPLPLPTAMTCLIPGSFSGPAEGCWDDAFGAWSWSWCGPVVCMPQASFPSGRAMRSFLHLDLDVAFRHADAVARDGLLCRRTNDLPCPNFEPRAVPGAGHFVARDLSLGQGAAPMRVRVVEREERAVDIEQGDPLALDIDQSRLTGLDFVCLRYLHKVSQGSTAREGAATDRLSAS